MHATAGRRIPKARWVANATATSTFFQPARLRDEGFFSPYRQHVWVYACVNAIATNIAQVPWVIRTGTRKDPRVIETGPWVDLFDRPNPLLSRYQFWKSALAQLELYGESMWVKESRDDRRVERTEIPFELWPINGKLFDPVLAEGSTTRVLGWIYRPGGGVGVLAYEPHEVVHHKYVNPDNPIRGVATMDAVLRAARTDHKAQQFNENFFDNNALPGGILMTSRPLNDAQRASIRRAWEDRHQGPGKNDRTALLDGGLTFTASQVSAKDMQYIEGRKFHREEIAAGFKVPKFELTVYEDLNMATAQTADKNFVTKTLLPKMVDLQDTAYSQLFREPGKGIVWGEFDKTQIPALQEDLNMRLDAGIKMVTMGWSPNEVNKRLDLGMPEVSEEPEPPKAEPKPSQEATAPGAEKQEDAEDVETRDGEDEEIADDGNTGLADRTGLTEEEVRERVERLLERQGKKVAAIWQQIAKLQFAPFELRFQKRTRRFLMELRAEQLAKLRKFMSGRATLRAGEAEGALFDLQTWAKKIGPAHHDIYEDIVANGLDLTAKELGGNWSGIEPTDANLVEMVEKREMILGSAVESVRKKLARSVEQGIKNQESLDQIQDRIRKDFNSFSATKARMIARTEVANTTNAVRFEDFAEEGIEKHEWVTAHDEAVRPTHAAQDGKIVKFGNLFPNNLMFPGDPAGDAGEVINCRCIAIAAD